MKSVRPMAKALLRAILCGVCAPLLANAADIKIPAQALGAALQDLAKQSGVQIIFFSKVVEGHRAPELNGAFTPEAAVALLLDGTGLTYHVLNERAIEVSAAASAAARPVIEGPPAATASLPTLNAPLDQVEVIAPHEKRLSVIRTELQRLEQLFYAEYNKVNTVPQYGITCAAARRGARLTERNCQPAFVATIREEAAQARWGGRCAPPSLLVILDKTPAYQKNMVHVVEKHPELLKILKQRFELAQRYESLRKGDKKRSDTAASGIGIPQPVAKKPDANGSRPVAPPVTREAPASGIIPCESQDLTMARLSTDKWAVANGLQRVQLDGKQYFCPRDVAPGPSKQSCVTLGTLTRARYGLQVGAIVIQGFEYPSSSIGNTENLGFENMNPLHQP